MCKTSSTAVWKKVVFFMKVHQLSMKIVKKNMIIFEKSVGISKNRNEYPQKSVILKMGQIAWKSTEISSKYAQIQFIQFADQISSRQSKI